MKVFTDLSVTSRPHRPRTGWPAGVPAPALDLNFATGSYAPSGFGGTITFMRAGSATYHDATGMMQTAGSDQPRLDRNRGTGTVRGLLLEGSRTNLVLGSHAPVSQSVTVTAEMHTLSFYGTGSVTLGGAFSGVLTGADSTLRAVLVFTPSAGALTLTVAGDVQLAQLEAGNCPTSYIPTTGAPVTRAADRANLPLGAWWNPNAGSLLVEWLDINHGSSNTRLATLHSGFQILQLQGAVVAGGASNTVGTRGASLNLGVDITKGPRRAVVGWTSAGGITLASHAQMATTAGQLWTSGTPATLHLGRNSNDGNPMNGCLRRIVYWPQRLGDAALLSLAPGVQP
jgi:hypothetical protein